MGILKFIIKQGKTRETQADSLPLRCKKTKNEITRNLKLKNFKMKYPVSLKYLHEILVLLFIKTNTLGYLIVLNYC